MAYFLVAINWIKDLHYLGLDKRSGTLAFWFNTKGYSGLRTIIANEGSDRQIFNLYIDEQNIINLILRDKSDNTKTIITTNTPLQYIQWYFIALKWQYTDGTLNCTLYVNTDEIYTGNIDDFKDFTGGTTALGSSIFGKYFLNGYIKDFSYSSNELSENDIISLYNKTLEDDTGTTITNSYTYENDRIKTITHNDFSYSFGYDSFGNNETVDVAGQNLITNNYNPITGNLEEFQYGNGQRISLDYDKLNRVTARNFKNTTDQEFNARYTYQYDNSKFVHASLTKGSDPCVNLPIIVPSRMLKIFPSTSKLLKKL